MYWRMKLQRSKTDACHLWALLCEGNFCGWVRKASAPVGFIDSVPTQLLCGARNNSSMSRKPEAGDFMGCAPHFLVARVRGPVFSGTCARKSHRRNMWGSLSPCCKVSPCFSMLYSYATNSWSAIPVVWCCLASVSWSASSMQLTAGCAFCAPCFSAYKTILTRSLLRRYLRLLKTFWTRSRLFLHYRIRNQFLAGGALSHFPPHPWCPKHTKNHVTFERFITVSFC